MEELRFLTKALTWPYLLLRRQLTMVLLLWLASGIVIWGHILIVYPFIRFHLSEALKMIELSPELIARTTFFSWLILFVLILPLFVTSATHPSMRAASSSPTDSIRTLKHVWRSYFSFLDSFLSVCRTAGILVLGPVAIVFVDYVLFQRGSYGSYRSLYWVIMGFIFMGLLYKSMTYLLFPLCSSLFVCPKREAFQFSRASVQFSGLLIGLLSLGFVLISAGIYSFIPFYNVPLPLLAIPAHWIALFVWTWAYLSSLSCVVIHSVWLSQQQANPSSHSFEERIS